jgi:hypothetical protein
VEQLWRPYGPAVDVGINPWTLHVIELSVEPVAVFELRVLMEYSEELVSKFFEKDFGDESNFTELFEFLMSFKGNEPERVQLAILKLSEGDPDKLRQNVELAKIDYRDVLAGAEYPEQMESGATAYNTETEDYEAILARDREQYESWLAEVSDSQES